MSDPTDIVERLEEWATLLRGDPSFDAIDEIVKLREALSAICRAGQTGAGGPECAFMAAEALSDE